nr:AraC family transcriptional regulator [Sphingomonas caseinilyticus]
MTRSATLTGYGPLALSVGLDPAAMLKEAKLPIGALSDPDLPISGDAVMWLLEESARRTDCVDFGLRLAETRSVANLGDLALLIRDEPTLRAAVQSIVRYSRLHNNAFRLILEEVDDLGLLHLVPRAGGWTNRRQGTEMAMAIVLRTLRHLTHGSFRPTAVNFSHADPSKLETHRRVFACAVLFQQDGDALVCRSKDLDIPVPAADPDIGHQVKRRAEAQLGSLAEATDEQARDIARRLLPTGRCSVGNIAKHLGCDRRTLHRRLVASGGANKMIAGVRADLAASYLTSGRKTFYEVSELLGFSSASAFSRWFHRQFGESPSAWRKRHRA